MSPKKGFYNRASQVDAELERSPNEVVTMHTGRSFGPDQIIGHFLRQPPDTRKCAMPSIDFRQTDGSEFSGAEVDIVEGSCSWVQGRGLKLNNNSKLRFLWGMSSGGELQPRILCMVGEVEIVVTGQLGADAVAGLGYTNNLGDIVGGCIRLFSTGPDVWYKGGYLDSGSITFGTFETTGLTPSESDIMLGVYHNGVGRDNAEDTAHRIFIADSPSWPAVIQQVSNPGTNGFWRIGNTDPDYHVTGFGAQTDDGGGVGTIEMYVQRVHALIIP